jgi:hypothetical protein
VPLGDSYLELVAVVDPKEAASSEFGSWVGRRLAEAGERPAAICLRTDDVDAVVRRTGSPPQQMSRVRPDGVELAWRLVALDSALIEGLPFFIKWDVADADHPGRVAVNHRKPFAGIEWVELGGDADRLGAWLGPHQLPLRHVAGSPGPRRVGIAVTGGDSIVIGSG